MSVLLRTIKIVSSKLRPWRSTETEEMWQAGHRDACVKAQHQEAEAEGQKFKATVDYIVRPCSKTIRG